MLGELLNSLKESKGTIYQWFQRFVKPGIAKEHGLDRSDFTKALAAAQITLLPEDCEAAFCDMT